MTKEPAWIAALNRAVDLINRFEPVARENGYHLALTGSCLYGTAAPEDIDILVYWHDGIDPVLQGISKEDHEEFKIPLGAGQMELLNKFGLTAEQCCEEEYASTVSRNVYITYIDDVKVDFIFLKA